MTKAIDPEIRFMRFVSVQPNECWLWTGATNGRYGEFRPGGSKPHVYAHRFAYEHWVGPIPNKLELGHLPVCQGNELCVNYGHVRPVTRRINVLESQSPSSVAARKTSCKNGHELKDGNFYRYKGQERKCIQCCKDRAKKRRENANFTHSRE